jgi:hypothetical protein
MVTFYAARSMYLGFLGQARDFSKEEVQQWSFRMDSLVFLAYLFNILSCKNGVIPLSRCNTSSDIIGHHAPILFLILPLDILLWANLQYLDPTVDSILGLKVGHWIRNKCIRAFVFSSGLLYMSSLNEGIMSFQRVERNLQGITTFRGIPQMPIRVFSSRLGIGLELCYKLLIFWFISIICFIVIFLADKSVYDYIVMSSTSGYST